MLGSISPTGSVTYPWYCDAWGIGAWFNNSDACKVVTQQQIDASTLTAIQKAAGGGTPAYNQGLVDTQYQGYLGDVAALCRTDPVGCQAYKDSSCPMFQTFNSDTGICEYGVGGNINWTMIGAIAIGVVGLLVVTGDSGARRYGR